MEDKFYYIGNSQYQGLLSIVKDRLKGNLLISCTEIDSQWDNPTLALEDNQSKYHEKQGYNNVNSATNELIESATWEEIKAAGWDKYVINKPTNR
jgi:hypothetical protein